MREPGTEIPYIYVQLTRILNSIETNTLGNNAAIAAMLKDLQREELLGANLPETAKNIRRYLYPNQTTES